MNPARFLTIRKNLKLIFNNTQHFHSVNDDLPSLIKPTCFYGTKSKKRQEKTHCDNEEFDYLRNRITRKRDSITPNEYLLSKTNQIGLKKKHLRRTCAGLPNQPLPNQDGKSGSKRDASLFILPEVICPKDPAQTCRRLSTSSYKLSKSDPCKPPCPTPKKRKDPCKKEDPPCCPPCPPCPKPCCPPCPKPCCPKCPECPKPCCPPCPKPCCPPCPKKEDPCKKKEDPCKKKCAPRSEASPIGDGKKCPTKKASCTECFSKSTCEAKSCPPIKRSDSRGADLFFTPKKQQDSICMTKEHPCGSCFSSKKQDTCKQASPCGRQTKKSDSCTTCFASGKPTSPCQQQKQSSPCKAAPKKAESCTSCFSSSKQQPKQAKKTDSCSTCFSSKKQSTESPCQQAKPPCGAPKKVASCNTCFTVKDKEPACPPTDNPCAPKKPEADCKPKPSTPCKPPPKPVCPAKQQEAVCKPKKSAPCKSPPEKQVCKPKVDNPCSPRPKMTDPLGICGGSTPKTPPQAVCKPKEPCPKKGDKPKPPCSPPSAGQQVKGTGASTCTKKEPACPKRATPICTAEKPCFGRKPVCDGEMPPCDTACFVKSKTEEKVVCPPPEADDLCQMCKQPVAKPVVFTTCTEELQNKRKPCPDRFQAPMPEPNVQIVKPVMKKPKAKACTKEMECDKTSQCGRTSSKMEWKAVPIDLGPKPRTEVAVTKITPIKAEQQSFMKSCRNAIANVCKSLVSGKGRQAMVGGLIGSASVPNIRSHADLPYNKNAEKQGKRSSSDPPSRGFMNRSYVMDFFRRDNEMSCDNEEKIREARKLYSNFQSFVAEDENIIRSKRRQLGLPEEDELSQHSQGEKVVTKPSLFANLVNAFKAKSDTPANQQMTKCVCSENPDIVNLIKDMDLLLRPENNAERFYVIKVKSSSTNNQLEIQCEEIDGNLGDNTKAAPGSNSSTKPQERDLIKKVQSSPEIKSSKLLCQIENQLEEENQTSMAHMMEMSKDRNIWNIPISNVVFDEGDSNCRSTIEFKISLQPNFVSNKRSSHQWEKLNPGKKKRTEEQEYQDLSKKTDKLVMCIMEIIDRLKQPTVIAQENCKCLGNIAKPKSKKNLSVKSNKVPITEETTPQVVEDAAHFSQVVDDVFDVVVSKAECTPPPTSKPTPETPEENNKASKDNCKEPEITVVSSKVIDKPESNISEEERQWKTCGELIDNLDTLKQNPDSRKQSLSKNSSDDYNSTIDDILDMVICFNETPDAVPEEPKDPKTEDKPQTSMATKPQPAMTNIKDDAAVKPTKPPEPLKIIEQSMVPIAPVKEALERKLVTAVTKKPCTDFILINDKETKPKVEPKKPPVEAPKPKEAPQIILKKAPKCEEAPQSALKKALMSSLSKKVMYNFKETKPPAQNQKTETDSVKSHKKDVKQGWGLDKSLIDRAAKSIEYRRSRLKELVSSNPVKKPFIAKCPKPFESDIPLDTREDTSKIISKMAKNKELVLSLYKRTKFEDNKKNYVSHDALEDSMQTGLKKGPSKTQSTIRKPTPQHFEHKEDLSKSTDCNKMKYLINKMTREKKLLLQKHYFHEELPKMKCLLEYNLMQDITDLCPHKRKEFLRRIVHGTTKSNFKLDLETWKSREPPKVPKLKPTVSESRIVTKAMKKNKFKFVPPQYGNKYD
ncbi:uncharacterized protein LOC109603818 isoform X3 [Aethina tumida]|uniref:uncharacterized protein LOC109603818 isoform X3 n=1 Tax=Aethina tumida TaxID=116153 RepID=UPI0021477991|nr:uncharacterized protein LOC109603818 isoform X3 [Aethina tumida]